MHPAIEILQSAIGYAKFSDPDVRKKTISYLNRLGSDLESAGYEEGIDSIEAGQDLSECLDDLDRQREEFKEATEDMELDTSDTDEG